MSTEENYIAMNRTAWDNKTAIHVESAFYDMPGFMSGQSSLKAIELGLLGDINGKSILHLQCHFGQDSISLARMGARVTGVDFSPKAIEQARAINQTLNTEVRFIECTIYDLPNHLNEPFDVVFTSYGTIGWLPDLDRWAKVVSTFLKPGGQFIMVDFHPVVWMFDNHFKYVQYPYFKAEPIIETETGTYADKQSTEEHTTISWNHSMAELLTALLHQDLSIQQFHEYDYSPYACFNEVVEDEPDKFRIAHLGNKIPMTYALVATRGVFSASLPAMIV